MDQLQLIRLPCLHVTTAARRSGARSRRLQIHRIGQKKEWFGVGVRRNPVVHSNLSPRPRTLGAHLVKCRMDEGGIAGGPGVELVEYLLCLSHVCKRYARNGNRLQPKGAHHLVGQRNVSVFRETLSAQRRRASARCVRLVR
eukprot:scaffold6910_cov136-Isochrysis_galbana.AAC.8